MASDVFVRPLHLRLLALVAALWLAAAAVLAAAPVADAKPAGTVDFWLTILHNNDGESKLLEQFPLIGTPPASDPTRPFAGVARFKSLVDQLRADALEVPPGRDRAVKRGVVMLSSGDNFLAGAEFTASLRNGVPFYDSIGMSLIGYDAIAIGNHEFDFGPDVLADFIEGFSTPTPFLSANLDVSAEPRLAALVAAGRIAPSTIVVERGERIGIIGATTPQLPNISSPRDVVVGPVAPAVQAQVASLAAQGVNKIILISHLQNVAEDLALAGQLSGVDVMIAGGGDELLANPGDPLAPVDTTPAGLYPLYATDGTGTQIPVITTAGDYKYVGRLVVGFDKTGAALHVHDANLVGASGGGQAGRPGQTPPGDFSGPVRVVGFGGDAVAPDPTVEAEVVQPVAAFTAGLAANVLASSEVPLNGRRGGVTTGTEIITEVGVRTFETNVGNLTADSLLWQAQQKAAEFGVDSPQVALQNGGGIRNNSVIAAGPISELHTFQILAFANFVSIKEDLSADQLKAVLETSVSEIGNGRFGQWAGVTFTFDPSAQRRAIDNTTCAVSNPGARIQDVTVGGVQIFDDGIFVGPAGWTVDIASNDFTFRVNPTTNAGGDCYAFGGGSFTTVGVSYQQALVNYLTAPVSSGGLGGVITAGQYPATPTTVPVSFVPTRIIPI